MFLVLMTAIAVVSDSLLHPFYPQFFASVFGIRDPEYVGNYIAASHLTVILSFPLWARLAKHVSVLQLLVGTQLATGVLSVASYLSTSLVQFWLLSLAMFVFKASYLLIYPYVMSVEDKRHHIGTISMLAFVVYFGNILAALLSGAVFELLDARSLFIGMACGDVLQIAFCLYMLRRPVAAAASEASPTQPSPLPPRFLARLGVVMFVLYFSASLTEPFFSSYWESIAGFDNKIVSGCAFAIPGVAAILGFYVNTRLENEPRAFTGIVASLLLGLSGLWLQLSGVLLLVIGGRFLFGWALFQSMVKLDHLLFRYSTPESYAVDFSKINLFQGLGVLVASSAAGALVESAGVRVPFVVAAGGLLAGVLLYVSLFRDELRADGGALEGEAT
jgi:DHA1 family multidrug resistance protein-like MFS transporter